MKKRRFLAMLLVCCMVFGQTVWAQDAEEGQQIVKEEEEAIQEELVEDKVIYTNYPCIIAATNVLFGNVDENAWEFISANESICKGSVEFQDSTFGDGLKNCYINLIGEKEGSTVIKVKEYGIERFAYRVTVVEESPDNVICFKDDALLKAVLRGYNLYVDTDKDGYITKEELAKAKYLDLVNCGITDLSGLEYAENLESIYLRGNTELENVDVLLQLSNLEYIDIADTKVPAETRMKLAKFESNIEMTKGHAERLVKTTQRNEYIFDEELQVSVVEGEKDAVAYVYEKLLAKKEGDVVIRIAYKENTLDIPVHVKGIPADQEVGDSSELGLLKTTEDKILSSNGILWQTYPEMAKVKENVEDYVAGWIYSGKDSVKYEYTLDKDRNLWSDKEKIAENVKKYTGHYALDNNGVLIDIYNTNKSEIENVVDVRSIIHREYDRENDTLISKEIPYILKSDGTLWSRQEVDKEAITNEFQRIKENVKEIGTYGYLLENGDYIKYDGDGSVELSNMDKITDEYYITYYLGKDGNSYVRYHGDGNDSFVNIGDAKVIAAHENYVKTEEGWRNACFYLTADEKLYEYIEDGNDKLIDEDVVEISAPASKNMYKTKDGLYRDLNGTTGTVEKPLEINCIHVGNGEYVWLEDYGAAEDYNLTKNGVLILTHVKSCYGNFAVRTDGTVWDITGIPEMLLDLESSTVVMGDVNGDGKVNIEDLRIILRGVCGKIELTSQQIKSADVVADGKVDIQDLRKTLRFVCGKIEEL